MVKKKEEIEVVEEETTVLDKRARDKVKIQELREKLNKKMGVKIAFDPAQENPSEVKDWIPTGSRWLDCIIARGLGRPGGIPTGKIVVMDGQPGTGKSYIALQIAANAMKKGMLVVYMDSESNFNSDFVEKIGADPSDIIYVQAITAEKVLETVEFYTSNSDVPMLFIWDSLSNTSCEADRKVEAFDPSSAAMGGRPRVLSLGFKILTIPLGNTNSTFLILSQLYTNLNTKNPVDMMMNPFKSQGGQALKHASSLTFHLNEAKAADSYIYEDPKTGDVVTGSEIEKMIKDKKITREDKKDFQAIGSEVRVTIEKSRFGSLKRNCEFKILWGTEDAKIRDEESWLEAIKPSPYFSQAGAWMSIKMEDGTETKFQTKNWLEELQDETFKKRVLQMMDELYL